MDPFALPSPEKLREIAAKQDAKAREIRAARKHTKQSEQTEAAEVIQRNYRGYRERRQLEGYALDSSTRWIEAVKEVQYRNITRPTSRRYRSELSIKSSDSVKGGNSLARDQWRRVGAIAQRAGSDDTSESAGDDATDAERAALREKKRKAKAEREKLAKMMGLEYFLEMVDQKHRYGSNLRRYHQEWKKADTNENFFYWLDFGEGKNVDLEDRPRKRLDTEQVRYLSREERLKYLISIDKQGRFVFAKNGIPVTTSPYFKDSIDGIVPVDDKTPTWREVTTGEKELLSAPSSSDNDLDSDISTGSQEDASKYTNQELHDAKGLAKLNHVSVNSILNHMMRKTTKKNTWIFVADTSFRLYLGIKQSGAFQHSSFLHGARVSAAGLIRIKRGQLRRLSPLSGHYAPPARNFHEFVKSLKEAGADMSRVNISRSYTVLLGLETYLGAKKQVKTAEQSLKDILNPQEKRKREEAERDKSKSAEKERQVLEEREKLRRQQSLSTRMMQKLKLDESGLQREKSRQSVADAKKQ